MKARYTDPDDLLLINPWTTAILAKEQVHKLDKCGTLILSKRELRLVPNLKGKGERLTERKLKDSYFLGSLSIGFP